VPKPPENPRKKALAAIARKLALFVVQETFTDEPDQQNRLGDAIKILDEVGDQLAANDEAAQAAKP
jgi:hypothetical protein